MKFTKAAPGRKLPLLLWIAVFGIFELSALSCGPDFPTAAFVLPDGPGGNYAAFAAGHLGVLQPRFHTRSLAVAFNWLSARPLSAAEQQQAASVNMNFADRGDFVTARDKAAPPSGFATWINARTALGKVAGYVPDAKMELDQHVPDSENYGFVNCLDPAFAAAAQTLAARIKSYGAGNPKDPSVLNWVSGQDAVFANCGSDPSAPLPPPHLPAAAQAGAPQWLVQDRAYQLAAAQFYATKFDDAITSFRAIAADTSSPWSAVSRYLVARALIRKATLADDYITGPADQDTAKMKAAADQLHATLGMAQKELIAMHSDPHMASLLPSIDGLLDFVNLRYQPDAQAVVLAKRLHEPNTPHFDQTLIDLTYLRTDHTDATQPPPAHGAWHDPAGMLDWIDTVSASDEASALKHWQASHQSAWLLAAIEFAKPGDATVPQLLTAAQAVPLADPAWTAVTYHRLRLMPPNAATRAAVLSTIAQLRKDASPSTLNLFAALNAATAPTLSDWLASAGRKAAGDISGYGTSVTDGPSTDDPAASPVEDVCGKKITGQPVLFDADAAVALNQMFPLTTLATAAESTTLPENLRFQVAQATWVRAVILDKPEIAHRMTPVLISCRATWKPVLDAYDASKTDDDRHANGLLALMRFASTEPSVREGYERRSGFATYDEYRQNWWCTTVPDVNSDIDSYFDPNQQSASAPSVTYPSIVRPVTPLFLTAADKSAAAAEVAALKKIPNASDYFAAQALAWFKAHPQDPRTADIVGEANQVLRNSCRNDGTPKFAKALFDVLHQSFPQSSWTKKYKTWE